MENLFEFDKNYINKYKLICGVDEVGRGPLAGPVVVAAVILKEDCRFSYLDDSKKLNEAKREVAYDEIIKSSLAYSIVEKPAEIIDEINILQATLSAMKEAVVNLNKSVNFVLVDGNQKIDINTKQETVIKGDSKSAHIAAASILAKVHRDRLMQKYDEKFPQYFFSKNKGYGTEAHRAAIKVHGPCLIHRKTFIKKLYNEDQMSLF